MYTFVSVLDAKNMIGKRVSAIGDCGMTKDVKVTGTLSFDNDFAQTWVITDSSGQRCSINKNTLTVIE